MARLSERHSVVGVNTCCRRWFAVYWRVDLRTGRHRQHEAHQGSQWKESTHNEEKGRRFERLPRESIRDAMRGFTTGEFAVRNTPSARIGCFVLVVKR